MHSFFNRKPIETTHQFSVAKCMLQVLIHSIFREKSKVIKYTVTNPFHKALAIESQWPNSNKTKAPSSITIFLKLCYPSSKRITYTHIHSNGQCFYMLDILSFCLFSVRFGPSLVHQLELKNKTKRIEA